MILYYPLSIKSIVLLALTMNALFLLAIRMEWIKFIPGMKCESFGCMGLGIVYFALGIILPLVFAIIITIINKSIWKKSLLIALASAYGGMILVFSLSWFMTQHQIQKDTRQAEQACLEYPQLCPPKN